MPLNHYSFETVVLLRQQMDVWKEDVITSRCKNPDPDPNPAWNCKDFDTYLIEVNLDALPGPESRALKSLPTSFRLQDEHVDHLRDAARRVLKASSEFQRLVTELQSPPGAPRQR